MRWTAPFLGLLLALQPVLSTAAPIGRGKVASTASSSSKIAPVHLGQNSNSLSLSLDAPNLSMGGVLPDLPNVKERGLLSKGPEAMGILHSRIIESEGTHPELPVEDIFAESDVILFGESHDSLSSIKTVTSNLERMQLAGVEVMGIEGLKTFSQKTVDHYLNTKNADLPMEALSFSPARTTEFKELLIEAKRLGVRVVALGRPLDQWGRRVAGLAAARTGRAPVSFEMDLKLQVQEADLRYEKGFNESVAEVALQERNGDMASILKQELPEGAKAVVLAGAGHVEHPEELEFRLFGLPVSRYGTMADALKNELLSAFSVTLTGGVFTEVQGAADQKTILGPLFSLITTALITGQQAFLPTSERTGILHMGAGS